MKKLFLLFLIFLPFLIFSQIKNIKILHAKVIANSIPVERATITNITDGTSLITDDLGQFSIYAKEGDLIKISGVAFQTNLVVLKAEDFGENIFIISIKVKLNQLEEVKVTKLSGVSLGIVSPFTKHYTPAERKLRTAEELHWYSPLLIPLGGMSVDGMINSVSGRTAMLKKEVEVEKKETLMDKIDGWYETKYFTQTLKIPEEYVKGFEYYIVEDAKFAEAVKSKNKTMATFIMNDLAVRYKGLLQEK